MSWLRCSMSICMPEPGAYYSAISPVEFYEWKFTNKAPKGSVFNKHLPPSDVFATGKMVVSAIVSPDQLVKTTHGYELKSDTPVDISLKIGSVYTPSELLDKHKQNIKTLSVGLDYFKIQMKNRTYVSSQEKNPSLYKIVQSDNSHVYMQNFGAISDLIGDFASVRDVIQSKALSRPPHSKAIDLEEFRRYENAMDFVNNSHLYVDASKIERLLRSSKIKPKQTKKVSWRDYYFEIFPRAQILQRAIDKFGSFSWVKASSN